MTARARRTVAYVFLVLFAGLGIYRLERTTDDLHTLIRSEAHEDRVEDALQCVTSWRIREQIRDSDEAHGRAAGEALIDVVQPDDPVIVERYRAALAEHLRAASDEIANPTCDLDHARRVVAENPGVAP